MPKDTHMYTSLPPSVINGADEPSTEKKNKNVATTRRLALRGVATIGTTPRPAKLLRQEPPGHLAAEVSLSCAALAPKPWALLDRTLPPTQIARLFQGILGNTGYSMVNTPFIP